MTRVAVVICAGAAPLLACGHGESTRARPDTQASLGLPGAYGSPTMPSMRPARACFAPESLRVRPLVFDLVEPEPATTTEDVRAIRTLVLFLDSAVIERGVPLDSVPLAGRQHQTGARDTMHARLRNLACRPAFDSLSFSVVTNDRRVDYSLRPTCDGLVGRSWAWRTISAEPVPSPAVVRYRRVTRGVPTSGR